MIRLTIDYDPQTKKFDMNIAPAEVGNDRILMYGILRLAEERVAARAIIAELGVQKPRLVGATEGALRHLRPPPGGK